MEKVKLYENGVFVTRSGMLVRIGYQYQGEWQGYVLATLKHVAYDATGDCGNPLLKIMGEAEGEQAVAKLLEAHVQSYMTVYASVVSAFPKELREIDEYAFSGAREKALESFIQKVGDLSFNLYARAYEDLNIYVDNAL
jgi:hypothetical protein